MACRPRLFALVSICVALLSYERSEAATVTYDLHLDEMTVTIAGRPVSALAINGQIPAPTLEFAEGDTARINVHNHLSKESSVHWHGLLVPNDQDGVPGVTNPPIKPGTTFTYQFPIKHSGTYWYHSHSDLQEQRGLYGAIVIHPKAARVKADREHVLVLSDWTNESPEQVLRNLRTDGDYYALKKRTIVSWLDAAKRGKVKELAKMEWGRMPPMDLSDVGYDTFLSNGKPESELSNLRPGEKLRLRVVNAAASTYFYLGFAGGTMEVVSSDGVDVKPVKANQILIGIGETYDLLLSLPKTGAHEFRATAQDVSGYTSLFIGQGARVLAPNISKPDPFAGHGEHGGGHGDHGGGNGEPGNGGHAGHGSGEPGEEEPGDPCLPGEPCENAVALLKYSNLRSLESTQLPNANPSREYKFILEGDMERYVWRMNGKTLSEADKVLIRKGENIRFVLKNTTMMHHPMHLHGHFFRVLNGQGDFAPLKHTVDVAPMSDVTIEFEANEEKDWVFHCHNLYHMATGMGRIVSYQSDHSSDHSSALGHSGHTMGKHPGEKWMATGSVTALTNQTEASTQIFNANQIIEVNFDYRYAMKDAEFQVNYVRYRDQFRSSFVGIGMEDAIGKNRIPFVVAGVRRVLPMLVDSKIGVMTAVKNGTTVSLYLALEKKIQITDRVVLSPGVEYKNRELNGNVKVLYTVNPRLQVTAGVDSKNKVRTFGVGIRKKL